MLLKAVFILTHLEKTSLYTPSKGKKKKNKLRKKFLATLSVSDLSNLIVNL